MSLSNAHFYLIELFDMLYDFILLFFSFSDLLATSLYLCQFLLPEQLLALLDHVFSDAVFAEKVTLWADLSWLPHFAQAQTALIKLFL